MASEEIAFPADLFAGRVFLITGGTRGIGLEIAAQLLGSGAAVAICGRSASRGQEALERLSASRPDERCRFLAANIADPAACAGLIADIREAFGTFSGLLNCADSILQGARGRFEALEPEVFAPAFETAVLPTMNMVRAAIPALAEADGGSIVTFASDSGKVAGPYQSMVGTTKAAIMMFTRSVALEIARLGINLNCVSPSYVRDTPIYDEIARSSGGERVRRAEARAGLGLPDARAVARLALFLCSPWAAHITGQVVSINGGVTAA